MKKVTVSTLFKRKAAGEKLVMCTAYDAIQSRICMAAGIDFMLVGDSVGMTQLGYDNTLPVTMQDMLAHTAAVRRGAPEAFVVFDMPFMSYQESDADAMHNAGIALKNTGADAVKLEGGAEAIVRPSGTEPKIKTYFTTLGKDLAEAQAQKDALSAALKPIFS